MRRGTSIPACTNPTARAVPGPCARQRAGLAGAERRRDTRRQQLGFLAPCGVPGPEFPQCQFRFRPRYRRGRWRPRVAGTSLAEVYDEKPEPDGFRARGGKFIFFQGWADPVITPLMDVDFYDRDRRPLWPGGDRRLLPLLSAGGHGPLQRRRRASPISAAPPARPSRMMPITTWSRRWSVGDQRRGALAVHRAPISMTQSRSPPPARSAAIRWKRAISATATPKRRRISPAACLRPLGHSRCK